MADARAGLSEAHVNWEDQRRRRTAPARAYCQSGVRPPRRAPAGCASLRARPASYAVERACVEDGQEVEIVSGPFDPDGRDAWFEVWRPSKGPGWMLGDYLFAVAERRLRLYSGGRYTSVLLRDEASALSRRHGGMAEWTIAPVCKIGGLTAFAGSNPAPTTSATMERATTILGTAVADTGPHSSVGRARSW